MRAETLVDQEDSNVDTGSEFTEFLKPKYLKSRGLRQDLAKVKTSVRGVKPANSTPAGRIFEVSRVVGESNARLPTTETWPGRMVGVTIRISRFRRSLTLRFVQPIDLIQVARRCRSRSARSVDEPRLDSGKGDCLYLEAQDRVGSVAVSDNSEPVAGTKLSLSDRLRRGLD